MDTCHVCGGPLRAARVEYVGRWRAGPYVRVTDVPALVCERCGEEVYEADVVARLQRLVREGAAGADAVEAMPVKAFDPVAAGRG
jgi:YgiT-type zinc finger domain-containing protein